MGAKFHKFYCVKGAVSTMAAARTAEDAYVVTLSAGGQVAIPKFMRKDARAGDRFLIVKVDDGYYLKPVRSIRLRSRLEKAQAQVSRAVRDQGLSEVDLEHLVAKVRRERRLAVSA